MAISNYDINRNVEQQWITTTAAAAAAKSTLPQINARLRLNTVWQNRKKKNKSNANIDRYQCVLFDVYERLNSKSQRKITSRQKKRMNKYKAKQNKTRVEKKITKQKASHEHKPHRVHLFPFGRRRQALNPKLILLSFCLLIKAIWENELNGIFTLDPFFHRFSFAQYIYIRWYTIQCVYAAVVCVFVCYCSFAIRSVFCWFTRLLDWIVHCTSFGTGTYSLHMSNRYVNANGFSIFFTTVCLRVLITRSAL